MRHLWCFVTFFAAGCSDATAADAWDREPIGYRDAASDDPVARSIRDGSISNAADASRSGRLREVLDLWGVPVESQTLVFSKTSLQTHRVTPRHPRALYFNDDVYVGYVPGGDIEIAATDPQLGAVFYTIDMDKPGTAPIRDHGGSCLLCHANRRTQGVPGYLLRSVSTGDDGRPLYRLGSHDTTIASPPGERYGGYYLTGLPRSFPHAGRDDLSGVDLDAYPSPHSDLVPLLVLTHQAQMHNALARANHDVRRALHTNAEMNRLLDRSPDHLGGGIDRRIDHAVDRVVRHIVFRDEVSLPTPIPEPGPYVDRFKAMGPCDGEGRSLREFDLNTRTFQYRCSYLIYSDAFAGLPDVVRDRTLDVLRVGFRGGDDERFDHLAVAERTAIDGILTATLPGYAD